MLIISIEMFSARTKKRTLIGRAAIWNRGDTSGNTSGDFRGDSPIGNYDVAIGRAEYMHPEDVMQHPIRRGKVLHYPRFMNVWRLVIRGLLSAFPEEDKRNAG